jgi:hypothetical protein
MMDKKISNVSFSMLVLLIGLLSQHLVTPAISTTVEDQKNFNIPDPHSGNPPAGFSDSLCNSLTFYLPNFSNIYIKHVLQASYTLPFLKIITFSLCNILVKDNPNQIDQLFNKS